MSLPAAPERWLARTRRVVLLLVTGLLLYGWTRFDVVVLPEGALSPLYGIHAGDRLLVDRRAGKPLPGSDVLYRGPDGSLLLGRTDEPPGDLAPEMKAQLAGEACWVLLDRSLEGIPDSRSLGPIPSSAIEGRVVLVLPW
jgi:hypothetical protein